MTDKAKKFLQIYGAHFGPLREDEGRSLWINWIDEETTSLQLVHRVTEKISIAYESGKFDRKPKLGTFKRVYREMAGKRPVKKTEASETNCVSCRNSGKLHIVMAGDNAGTAKPAIRKPQLYPYMAVSTIPCSCPHGKLVNANCDSPWPKDALNWIHRNCSFAYGADVERFLDDCRKTDPQPPPLHKPLAEIQAPF